MAISGDALDDLTLYLTEDQAKTPAGEYRVVVTEGTPTSDITVTASVSFGGVAHATLSKVEGAAGSASVSVTIKAGGSQSALIYVRAVDDNVVEGYHTVSIIHEVESSDLAFSLYPLGSVKVGIEDNDEALVIISPSAERVTEGQNSLAPVAVSLGTYPSADEFMWGGDLVKVTFTSRDSSAILLGTLSGCGMTAPSATTLTKAGAAAPGCFATTATVSGFGTYNDDTGAYKQASETILVYAVPNTAVEGDKTVTLDVSVTSTSQPFNDLEISSVSLEVADDEVAEPTVTYNSKQVTSLTSNIEVGEGYFSQKVSVALSSKPTGAVTCVLDQSKVTSKITIDGDQLVITPSSVKFTTSNWNKPQEVSVVGVKDKVADGDAEVTIHLDCSSTDTWYNALFEMGGKFIVQADDSDVAGIRLSSGEGNAMGTDSILEITEGTATTVTVQLLSRPACSSCTVTVSLALSGFTTGGALTLKPAELVFAAETWDTPQSVSMTSAADSTVTGARAFSLAASVATTGLAYKDAASLSFPLQVADVDVMSASVSPSSITVSEGMASDKSGQLFVKLTAKPGDSASVLVSARPTGSQVTAGDVTFTASNWDVNQVIQVAAVDDDATEGVHSDEVCVFVGTSRTAAACAQVSILDNDLTTTTSSASPNGVTVVVTDSGAQAYIPAGGVATETSVTVEETQGADVAVSTSLQDSPAVAEVMSAYTTFLPHGLRCEGCSITLSTVAAPDQADSLVFLRTADEESTEFEVFSGSFEEVDGTVVGTLQVTSFSVYVVARLAPQLSIKASASAPKSYTENSPWLRLDPGISAALVPTAHSSGSALGFSAVVSAPGQSGSSLATGDELSIAGCGADGAGACGSLLVGYGASMKWASESRRLTVTAPAGLKVEAFQDILSHLAYRNTNDFPFSGARAVEVSVTEAFEGDVAIPFAIPGAAARMDFEVAGVNDPPVVLPSLETFAYDEGDGNKVLDPRIEIRDVDNARLATASIWIDPVIEGESFVYDGVVAGIEAYEDTFAGAAAPNGLRFKAVDGKTSLISFNRALQQVYFLSELDTAALRASGLTRTAYVRASDGNDFSAAASIAIEILPKKSAPYLSGPDKAVALSEDSAANFTITFGDDDGDTVNVGVSCNPSMGEVIQVSTSCKGGDCAAVFQYQPFKDRSGSDSVAIRAIDVTGQSSADYFVEFEVSEVMDFPMARNMTIKMTTGIQYVFDLDVGDGDGDDTISYIQIVETGAAGECSLTGAQASTVSFASEDGLGGSGGGTRGKNPVSILSNIPGSMCFMFQAVDADLNPSNIAYANVEVLSPSSDPPAAYPSTVLAWEGKATGELLFNVTHPHSLLLAVYEVTDSGCLGTTEMVAGKQGSYVYTPHPYMHGTDVFTYRATIPFDSGFNPQSDSNDVTVIIQDVNYPPRVLYPAGIQQMQAAISSYAQDPNKVGARCAGAAGELFGLGSSANKAINGVLQVLNGAWEDSTLHMNLDVLTALWKASNPLDLFGAAAMEFEKTFSNAAAAEEPGPGSSFRALSAAIAAGGEPYDGTPHLFAPALDTTIDLRMGIESTIALLAVDFDGDGSFTVTTLPESGTLQYLEGASKLPVTPGIPFKGPVYYTPDPLSRGVPFDGFTWQAVDGSYNVSATARVVLNVQCGPGHVVVLTANGTAIGVSEATECKPCAPGTRNSPSPEVDQLACEPCPAGQFASSEGSTECQACAPGTYAPEAGAAACLPCTGAGPVGGIGTSVSTESGATREDQCFCVPGYFRNAALADEASPRGVCTRCFDQLRVDSGEDIQVTSTCQERDQRLPLPLAGFWVNPASGEVDACRPESACVAHTSVEAVEAGICGPEEINATEISVLYGNVTAWRDLGIYQPRYQGRKCSECSVGYYRNAGDSTCEECASSAWVAYLVAGILALAVAPVLGKLSQLDEGFGAINIAITFLQVTSVFQKFDWQWPPGVGNWLQKMSVVNINLEVFSPECFTTSYDFKSKFIGTMAFPWIIAVLLSARVFIHYAHNWVLARYSGGLRSLLPAVARWYDESIEYEKANQEVKRSVWKTAVGAKRDNKASDSPAGMSRRMELGRWVFHPESPEELHMGAIYGHGSFNLALSWSYLLLTTTTLEYFNCTAGADGIRTLDFEPSTQCYSGYHMQLLPLAIYGFVAYTVGIPLYFFVMLYRYRDVLTVEVEIVDPLLKRRLREFKARFGFLYKRYEPDDYLWELNNLGRKLIITLARMVLKRPVEQLLMVMVAMLGYLAAVVSYKPFDSGLLDLMESFASSMAFMLMFTGFLFLSDILDPWEVQTTIWSIQVMLVFSYCVMAAFVLLDLLPVVQMVLRQWLQKRRLHKLRRGEGTSDGDETTLSRAELLQLAGKIAGLAGQTESSAVIDSAKKILKRDTIERLECWVHDPSTDRAHITKVRELLDTLVGGVYDAVREDAMPDLTKSMVAKSKSNDSFVNNLAFGKSFKALPRELSDLTGKVSLPRELSVRLPGGKKEHKWRPFLHGIVQEEDEVNVLLWLATVASDHHREKFTAWLHLMADKARQKQALADAQAERLKAKEAEEGAEEGRGAGRNMAKVHPELLPPLSPREPPQQEPQEEPRQEEPQQEEQRPQQEGGEQDPGGAAAGSGGG